MPEASCPSKGDMSNASYSRQLFGLAGWLALTFAAAAVGAVGSADAGAFYQQLQRPGWAPPEWLFAPAWSLLYLMMGVAAWLVWRARAHITAALAVYVVQLAVNALWTWLYFVWRQGALALAGIVLLDLLIFATLVAFWRIRPLAGALLAPYAAWVSYAGALTYATWRLNPDVLG